MEAKDHSGSTVTAMHLGAPRYRTLVEKFAAKYTIEPNRLLSILKATAFKVSEGKEVSNEQMAALLVVADQYNLNPFTKEIFAFEDKFKGIVPVVSVDGWSRIINEHQDYDGCDFEVGPPTTVADGGKSAFEWVKCTMYSKSRKHPVPITEYLDEVYQPPRGANRVHGPWQTHPKRLHRHKAFIQSGRIAFGFSGIYDEDEAQRIIDAGGGIPIPVDAGAEVKTGDHLPATRTDALAADLAKKAAESKPAEKIDQATGEITQIAISADAAREGIEVMVTPEECQRALEYVMKLPANDERSAIMKAWNERVMALAAKRDKKDAAPQAPYGSTEAPSSDQMPENSRSRVSTPAGSPNTGVTGERASSKGSVQPAVAAAKPKGTKKIRDQIVADLKKAATKDAAAEIMAASTLYDWAGIETTGVAATYDERLKELEQ